MIVHYFLNASFERHFHVCSRVRDTFTHKPNDFMGNFLALTWKWFVCVSGFFFWLGFFQLHYDFTVVSIVIFFSVCALTSFHRFIVSRSLSVLSWNDHNIVNVRKVKKPFLSNFEFSCRFLWSLWLQRFVRSQALVGSLCSSNFLDGLGLLWRVLQNVIIN